MTRKFEVSRLQIGKRVEALTLTFKDKDVLFDLVLPKELCEMINLEQLDERYLMYLIEFKQDKIIHELSNLLSYKHGRTFTFNHLRKDILNVRST